MILGHSLSLGSLQSWIILDTCPMQARNRVLSLATGFGSCISLFLLVVYQGVLHLAGPDGLSQHWGLAGLMSFHAFCSLFGQAVMSGRRREDQIEVRMRHVDLISRQSKVELRIPWQVPPVVDESRVSDFSDSIPRSPTGNDYEGKSVCGVLPVGRGSGGMGGAEALLRGSPGIKLDPPGYRRQPRQPMSSQVLQTREWKTGNGSRLLVSQPQGSDSD